MQRTPEEIRNELLVFRAQQGEPEAVRELVQSWQPRLVRHAYYATGSAELAADVVQEAWLAVVRSLHRLNDPATFRAWVFRIVANKAVDAMPRETKSRKLVDAYSHFSSDIAGDDTPGPEREKLDQLKAALRTLAGEQRQLLHLFYGEEMSVKEIAKVYRAPVGTIKHRLFRARQLLKTALMKEKRDE